MKYILWGLLLTGSLSGYTEILNGLDALNRSQQVFVAYTPPKCGTHLLAKALELLSHKECLYSLGHGLHAREFFQQQNELNKQNKFVITHTLHPPIIDLLVSLDYKIFFIIRDPRDQIVSANAWIEEGEWSSFGVAKITNTTERISELITGARFGYKCFEECILSPYKLLNLQDKDHFLIVRFEDLVGPSGGGTIEQQITTLTNMADFLHIPLSERDAEAIGGTLFGDTKTFRKGQIGRWKDIFTEEQRALFNKLHGDFLTQWGYPL